MTTVEIHDLHTVADHPSSLPAILAGAALLLLIGVPALMAPATSTTALDWHGNTASVTTIR
ncbi:hypothetical protein [Puniceibacterium sp. IMCC21224]|uniref:hypothetical protein n=1 Tax=Puniceibacterium sp. IMCC21224 TaxID=1618204 RepID=UPI00065D8823|nr:hypothetical protein [Puniceibacterium sp. IMCC21224]KMK67250.1 hypothetical protein IMCC21224_112117 [Puniceibacterium sp. IMCC21224]